MAGILDPKQRVMDFILTNEGRSQVAKGDLKIAYASFSDRDTFYQGENDGIATDASSRLYFEATQRYQDKIIIETDSEGNLINFGTADYNLAGFEVVTTPDAPRTASETKVITGSDVQEKSNDIITQITKNYYDHQLLGQEDIFTNTPGFGLSDESIEFNPSYTSPLDVTDLYDEKGNVTSTPNVDSYDEIVYDKKFAHLPNFKFMPPVNGTGSTLSKQPLGAYANLNQAEILEYSVLKDSLKGKQYHEISFSPSSRDNNIIIQPFEFTNDGKVEKLSIIDFGVFPNESGTSAGVHIFFMGKLIRGTNGRFRFFNIFTLELDV